MTTINSRIESLRKLMKEKSIDACVIPSSDPHASESPASYWNAREYFSGFDGSAGTLVVTQSEVGLWTDARYFIQAKQQLAGTGIKLFHMGIELKIGYYLAQTLDPDSTVAMNAWLFSVAEIERMQGDLSMKRILIDTRVDFLVDTWDKDGRPPFPESQVFIYPEKYAGLSVQKKLQLVREKMQDRYCDALLMNVLDEIAWLFNIRASDVEYNPLTIAYALVLETKVILFINQRKLNTELLDYLKENKIELVDYFEMESFLKTLSANKIWIDSAKMNYALYQAIVDANNICRADSPVLHLKSIKNECEIHGIRQAMVKDGVAMVKFNRWMEQALDENQSLTEMLLAEKLRAFRAEQDLFFDESFAAIVGYGAHGAISHYEASERTNAKIERSGFLLIDSGAQYLDGTTDITRTFALGKLDKRQKSDFTLVLKGHIALAQAEFPQGTCGDQLDDLARQFLKKKKLDYGHATGHGIGCFLCVHEGPQFISGGNQTVLLPGMIISNEPSVHREDEYGIRLENVILVKKSEKLNQDEVLLFETLTLFPFDKEAIKMSMLTAKEIHWLNEYHRIVFEKLSPWLSQEEEKWLEEKCKAIKSLRGRLLSALKK